METTQRQRLVRRTYLCFTLPVGLVLMLVCASLYAKLVGLPMHEPMKHQSLWVQLGLLVALIGPIPVGFSIGGWLWSRFAKRFLGVTREDMEALLLGGTCRVGYIDRANRRAINKLFGERGLTLRSSR